MRNIPLILFFLFLLFNLNGIGQTQTMNYTPDTEIFKNPERGIMSFISTKSSDYHPIEASFLQSEKNDNISITFLLYYLDTFMTSPISSTFLAHLQTDFLTIRQNGFKVILRFAYSDTYSTPLYLDSPTKALVLQHINQLTPILQENRDIIAVLQAGFIGTWGEEAYSDVFGTDWPEPFTAANIADRKEIYNALLAAIPIDKFISSRTPIIKSKLYNYTMPHETISPATAYNGSTQSRIGFHNDCFLSNYTDSGTYGYSTNDTIITKPYVANESKYIPIGGETCGYDNNFGNCTNTIKEMKRFHWSYLNKYYHPDNISQWTTGGCIDNIKKSLGYRFEILNTTFPMTATTNENLIYNIQINNIGFSAPFNPRNVELVLKNNNTSDFHRILLPNTDPRHWFANETITINEAIVLPNTIPSGNYHIYLNLPDPEPTLNSNPNYSIRFANTNIWESSTGYNDLNLNININNALGISEIYQDKKFSIAPNPASYSITIQLNTNQKETFEIYNMIGKKIKEILVQNNTTIPISDLTNGVYYVKLKNELLTVKLIKQ